MSYLPPGIPRVLSNRPIHSPDNMGLVPESRGRALYVLSLLLLLGTVLVQVSKQAEKFRLGGTTLSRSKESHSELLLPDIR